MVLNHSADKKMFEVTGSYTSIAISLCLILHCTVTMQPTTTILCPDRDPHICKIAYILYGTRTTTNMTDRATNHTQHTWTSNPKYGRQYT